MRCVVPPEDDTHVVFLARSVCRRSPWWTRTFVVVSSIKKSHKSCPTTKKKSPTRSVILQRPFFCEIRWPRRVHLPHGICPVRKCHHGPTSISRTPSRTRLPRSCIPQRGQTTTRHPRGATTTRRPRASASPPLRSKDRRRRNSTKRYEE